MPSFSCIERAISNFVVQWSSVTRLSTRKHGYQLTKTDSFRIAIPKLSVFKTLWYNNTKCSSCLFRENIQHHRRQGYCNPQKNHGCHDAEEHPALRVLKNRQSAFLEKKLQLRCTQTTERLIPRRRRLYQKEARRTSFFIAICSVCDSGKMGFTMKPQRKHQAEGADHRLARLL